MRPPGPRVLAVADQRAGASAPPATGRTILVVDDNDANRFAVGFWLRSAGYEVIEAASGAEALVRMEDHPDLVVLDVRLPDTDGFEICRTIKGNRATATTPVLHLSASFTTSEWRAHGLEGGADAYLTHPVEPRELLATIGSLLRVRDADLRVRAVADEWRATFDAITDVVLLVDDEGRVARSNRAATALFDIPFDRLVGASLESVVEEVFGVDARLAVARVREAAMAATGGRVTGREIAFAGRHWSVTIDPVRDRRRSAPGTGSGDTVWVLRDVSEQHAAQSERERLLSAEHRARADAEAARAEAEQANEAKAQFLATMSHELRTPLNAIQGHVQLLGMGIHGPLTDAQRDALARVDRAQQHLLGLITDILSFARLEAGRVEYDVRPVDLAAVLDDVSPMIEPQAAAKRLVYDMRATAEGVRVLADADKLRQILLNLLSNAAKFTDPEGRVTLRAEDDAAAGLVRIRVRDTGRGIPSDKLEQVFDPFVQVHRHQAGEARQGVGLGLAISRDLARGMGGELNAESVEGEGSTFTVTLRRAVR